jgi:chromosome segregation protein
VYLKSITMKGFKSFPDRTRLEFGPGTSVIVGPNGSGKSNVTDAVLWALGEQSPVAVRGQSMQDVIFGGAPGRQAASAAEVELVLDDSDGVLGIGPEVAILRRLDRSGDGEYRIAGARCRLIDVIELLSDTGLGKEMHSVISQGRVEAIVTSKPRDRRLLIEEAAGLGKHRKRRRRAQIKLGHTQDNLDRALDVEREARSRIKPLKRQAEAAELHERLHRQTLEARFELTKDDVRARRSELELATAAALTARSSRQQLAKELEQVAARRSAAEELLTQRSSQREELSRRSFAAQSAAVRVGERAEALRAAARSVSARLAHNREQLAALEAGAALDLPDPAAEGRIEALRQELEALERDREAELTRQLTELERELGELAAQQAVFEEQLEQAKQGREQAELRYEQGRTAIREAERTVDAARRESARVGGELAAVNQFLRSHQGTPGGARALADGLTVAAGYELAVAAALDGRLGAAVVGDQQEAHQLLDRSGHDGGRVLVTDSGREAKSTTKPPVEGAVRLSEQVAGEAPAAALAQALLADVWVVESLARVPLADFAGVLVTRDGRVWNPAVHELRQAAAVGEDRVLAERNRREQLIAESERAAQAEQAALADLEQAQAATGKLDGERDAAIAEHRSAVARRDELVESQRRTAVQIERRRTAPDEGENAGRRAQLRAELAAENARMEQAQRSRGDRLRRIAQLQLTIARDDSAAPVLDGLCNDLEALRDTIAERRAEFDAALETDRSAGEQVAATLRACAQEEAALQNRANAAAESLTEAEVRAQRARDRASESEQELRAVAAELQLEGEASVEPLTDDEREALATRLERIARRREQLGPVNPLAQGEYEEALAHVEELELQRTDLETALRELEKLIRDTDRQIRETFEQTFEAAAANFEELVPRVFPGGSGRLRLVSEEDKSARAADVAAEAADSTEPAEEPDGEEAGEDEDLLGVEIEVTPAGKAMKRLTLLSGGEKSMTALAFLFAVFLARPCPFYIMDEVEAALDDLNITRFLDLLDTYSERAQFIVVTHQKRTMEAADSLYGVSMGGDGISKVISRRLPAREAA